MTVGKLRWYYANANQCSRWASETTIDAYRQAFLDLASAWRALAMKEERRTLPAGNRPVVRHRAAVKLPLPNQIRSSRLIESNPSGLHLFNGDAMDDLVSRRMADTSLRQRPSPTTVLTESDFAKVQ